MTFSLVCLLSLRQVHADQWKRYYCTGRCQTNDALKLERSGRHFEDDIF